MVRQEPALPLLVIISEITVCLLVGTSTSTKWSTEHQEERTYDYRLYLASVTHLPESWRTDGEFQVGSKRCRWMTVDDMIADPKINDINHDVIHMLKDSI